MPPLFLTVKKVSKKKFMIWSMEKCESSRIGWFPAEPVGGPPDFSYITTRMLNKTF